MRFFLDASVDGEVGTQLEALGHRIERALPAEPEPGTAGLLQGVAKLGAQLVTADKAIIRAIYAESLHFNGIIIFLQGSPVTVANLFERFPMLKAGRLYTLTARKVKIRQLPQLRQRA